MPDEVLADLGAAAARRDGLRNAHLLMGYVAERDRYEQRWVEALERAAQPHVFIWGTADPVSGRHVLDHLVEHLPATPSVVLDGVGHYPHLEAPQLVAPQLSTFLARA